MDERELLRTVPIFSELGDEDIRSLARVATRRRYPKETVVFFENEEGDSFFMIIEGRIKVTILGDDGREIILSVLGPGDFFGEMALLDGGPRTATVTATTDIKLYALTEWVFRGLIAEHPGIAMQTLETMAGRLRGATKAASA